MNPATEKDFQKYIASAYAGGIHDFQRDELRKAFMAGMHLAGCRVKNRVQTLDQLVSETLSYGLSGGHRKNN